MTRICLSSTWADNIKENKKTKKKKKKLRKENSIQSADMYNQGQIRRGFGGFSRASPTPAFESNVHFHGKLWIHFGYRIYHKYPHPLFSPYVLIFT